MTFMSTTGQAPVPPAEPRGPLGPLLMTPGRWVALAVGMPVALALIGWTGFNLVTTVARGSYPFSYAIPVQDGQVAVNINAGDVTLQEAPGSSTARLTGTVQYGLIRPGISESNTPTGANIGMNCNGINTNCGMSASLDVPARTAVTLWSNGGNITASGFSSGVSLSAAGGNVTATNLAGKGSGGGNVTLALTQVPQNLQITTEGGNVTVILPLGSTTYDISTPDNQGANVSYPQSLVSATSTHKITIDSGGGDITISQA